MPSAVFRSGLFWSGTLTFIVMGVVNAVYGPALPALARSGGVALAEAGVLVSLHALGGLLALVAGALFGGVTGRIAVGAALVGSGLIALSGPWVLTMVGALVMGGGYGLIATVYNRRFLVQMGARGPAMVGLLNAIFGIGSIAGPLILVATGGSVHLTYGLIALALAALLPLADLGQSAAAAPAQSAPRFTGSGALTATLRRPTILGLGAAAVGIEAAAVGLGPAALIGLGLTEREAALTASAFFVAFLLGRLSLVWITAHVAALRLLAVALAAASACLAAATVAWPALFYALAGGAVGMFFPAYFVAGSDRYGTDERVASVILAAVYVGAVSIPATGAAVMGQAGGAAFFGMLAAMGLGAAGCTVLAALRPVHQPG
jgi:fucose permease